MMEMRLGRRARSRLNHKIINKTDKKYGLIMIDNRDAVERKASRNGRKSVFLPAGIMYLTIAATGVWKA